jgi:hypothetical protein
MTQGVPPEADYARFVRTVIDCLEAADVPYLVGGADAAAELFMLRPGDALRAQALQRRLLAPGWGKYGFTRLKT